MSFQAIVYRSWPALLAILASCTTPPVPPTACQFQAPTSQPQMDAYRIQVGDTLNVRFRYMQQFDDEVMVRPDGMISLMPVDEVTAAGLTPAELDRTLTEKFATIINQPDLSVIVRKFSSQRAYIGGEVKSPGMVPLDANLSALQAIMTAGGPQPTAALDQVLLIRRGEQNKCYVTRLNLNQAMSTGEGDMALAGFDIVYVPRTVITDIDIFVEQYISQLIPRGLGFQFLYNLRPEVQVQSDKRSQMLFSRQNIR